MQTLHSLARLDSRIQNAGVNLEQVIFEVVKLAQRYDSVAVCALKLPRVVYKGNLPYSTRRASNGNQVWAICRSGVIVTWMFRRDDQKRTADAFRVESIIDISSQQPTK